MAVRQISEQIYTVGVIDWNRRIFDELVPLPEGTSYNSYYVKGSEKTALIDTSDPSKQEEFIGNLIRLGINRLDYIVINHAEQDHAGCLPMLLELFPGAKVCCSQKCQELLALLLDVPAGRCQVVNSGDSINLGDRTLSFISAPWVHWPETMMTYCPEEEILFSCDLFGSHYATSDLFVQDMAREEILAKRYYGEIMMPFRSSIVKYMSQLKEMKISIIAPSHGPLVKPASLILDLYEEWTSDRVKNLVLIPYVSMHGSTSQMMNFLTELLLERGVGVKPFKVTNPDTGALAMELVDAATVVFATPTVLFGPHPDMVSVAYLANLIKPKTRYASIIGSYGWGGKTVDTLTSMISHIKAELLSPVYIQGAPNEKAQVELQALANSIAEKHSQDTLVIK
ncbi:MBL fold hydrolase [Methanospirillum lacunae]|uniref:MBL fold hydrolase n=2 Tax=Methanospirillum lacunae TaxID=668570 RepID=A0A2V2N3W6_9EURY|nr:FprA family A-type flavoprotein [Methanospirillum lacunae]PWR74499.1 MBL fold hydrolase [Methanospirillum lacunae]